MWITAVLGFLIACIGGVSGFLFKNPSISDGRRARRTRWSREVQMRASRVENGLAELNGLQNSKVVLGCTCGECFTCRAVSKYEAAAGCPCGICDPQDPRASHLEGCMCVPCATAK
jgi:hypothetical protein